MKLSSGASICPDQGYPQSRTQVGNTLPVPWRLYKIPSLSGSSSVSLLPVSGGDTQAQESRGLPVSHQGVRSFDSLCTHPGCRCSALPILERSAFKSVECLVKSHRHRCPTNQQKQGVCRTFSKTQPPMQTGAPLLLTRSMSSFSDPSAKA